MFDSVVGLCMLLACLLAPFELLEKGDNLCDKGERETASERETRPGARSGLTEKRERERESPFFTETDTSEITKSIRNAFNRNPGKYAMHFKLKCDKKTP
ncbi:uncharacterized protein UTRI_05509 [Ustilago trichophora]|uniref:Uncharacterized protein n=1 Tax=Ustilago trichophora TaxID=86804 RepID=A0A5C3EJ10_9BASI|nr:uncharacterized protein UTRI_05509 [Ustilago trichophora]